MATFDAAEVARIRRVSAQLSEAEGPVRVLRSVGWPISVRERFFARNAGHLPEVEYGPFDPDPTLRTLDRAREGIRDSGAVDDMLRRQAHTVEHSARMLAAIATPQFSVHSREVYGGPRDPLPDAQTTSLALAVQLDEAIAALASIDLGAPREPNRDAAYLAKALRRAVRESFGALAPKIVLVDDLSANAVAGPQRIRIRRAAHFSDLDIAQLINHEAYVHVGTALNGHEQVALPMLGKSHAGTTRTQEGLAVFAELISGSIDVDRMSRLAARVQGIEMATSGASFIEVYRYFLQRGAAPKQAFENTRRVFRGGVLTGGAPFTKDVVYLDGLLRVHNFLRVIVSAGRVDCLRLLFCGKLDIEDIPALAQLTEAGLCVPPRFLPPWARDLRFMVAYLAYSSFLNRIHLDRVREHYADLLRDTPVLDARG